MKYPAPNKLKNCRTVQIIHEQHLGDFCWAPFCNFMENNLVFLTPIEKKNCTVLEPLEKIELLRQFIPHLLIRTKPRL